MSWESVRVGNLKTSSFQLKFTPHSAYLLYSFRLFLKFAQPLHNNFFLFVSFNRLLKAMSTVLCASIPSRSFSPLFSQILVSSIACFMQDLKRWKLSTNLEFLCIVHSECMHTKHSDPEVDFRPIPKRIIQNEEQANQTPGRGSFISFCGDCVHLTSLFCSLPVEVAPAGWVHPLSLLMIIPKWFTDFYGSLGEMKTKY